METVPRIHVQKLPATTEQQYKAETERGIRKGRSGRQQAGAEKFRLSARTAARDERDDGQCKSDKRKYDGRGTTEGGRGQAQGLESGREVLLLRRRQTG